MPIVLLIRHGENNYVRTGRLAGRQPGIHLNEKGRQQAQAVADALAQKLEGHPLKVIYSSPMERAIETAQPIAEALNLQIVERPGLLEIDIGEWQNKKVKGLSRLKLWGVVQNTPSLMRFPGGETFSEAQFRICQEISTLAGQHEEKDIILCVSHADPIRLAVAYYLGLPLDQFQRLIVAPASLTVLHIGDSFSRLLTLNYDLSFNFPKP
jgi:probable phosphomutase (TIGR03848 family)